MIGIIRPALVEICCDSCPLVPTCEEANDLHREVFGLDDDEGEL